MWQRPTGGKLTEYEQANYTVPGVPKAIRERLSVNLNKLILDNAQVSDAGKYKCSYPGHGTGYVSLQVDVPLTGESLLQLVMIFIFCPYQLYWCFKKAISITGA